MIILAPGDHGRVILRAARKQHSCCGNIMRNGEPLKNRWNHAPPAPLHTPVIKKGEQYVEEFNSSFAFQSGVRYCAACAVVAGFAVEAS